jgi:putative lipoic acid-binding regulatory protein
MVNREYEQEAARLAKLSRADRFEELIAFPTRHMVKVIGDQAEIGADVQRVLGELGYGDVIPVERLSARGRYASVTVEVEVGSGTQLDALYSALERMPSVKYIF